MLWFSDNKGLATGISIMGFGLAKAIATPVMNVLQDKFGISFMFISLGIVYFVLMFIGHLLLKKPDGWVEKDNTEKTNLLTLFKNKKEIIGIWLMFYLNIHCGLMIISYEKQVLSLTFALSASLVTILNIVPSCTAIANALGRIGYSSLSDKLRQRNTIYKIIFVSCILVSLAVIFGNSVSSSHYLILGVAMIIFLLVVNLGYGGGFSTLPALLSERYGMEHISKIHGLVLSAWAIAGLTGNNTTEIILKLSDNSYQNVYIVSAVLYTVALMVCIFMVKNKKQTA